MTAEWIGREHNAPGISLCGCLTVVRSMYGGRSPRADLSGPGPR
jgi:hypothetical protein